jgi:hypothetical protein
MAGTLPEVTVTAEFSALDTWGDCFNTWGYQGSQEFAFALGYMYSEDAFWDFEKNLRSATPDQLVGMILHACAIYDYISENGVYEVMSAYQVVSPYTPYTPKSVLNPDTRFWAVYKAAGHWLKGNGSPMSVPIAGLNINLDVDKVGRGGGNPLRDFAATRTEQGLYSYDSGPYGYQTYNDNDRVPQLLVGGITLRTVGDFARLPDGSFQFYGTTAAYDDLFNMDERPDRPLWADVIVWTFNLIGGTDFPVSITGRVTTSLVGK